MSIFAREYNSGTFVPKNPDKCYNYNGKLPNAKPITFRSSWERMLCTFCDEQENILAYGSEILEIPYYSRLDNKTHKYVTDFFMVTKSRSGQIKKLVIEVKPASQAARLDEHGNLLLPPPPKKPTQRKLESWHERCLVIQRNNEKWTAAKNYCDEHGYTFKVITEKELGLAWQHWRRHAIK